ncbi:MAG: sigma-70 family RNA polymerase sigma factor [Clostridia bacterium]|nr:sigma-70 family RNA polymerase sigma factor [Clostridia bacterium]
MFDSIRKKHIQKACDKAICAIAAGDTDALEVIHDLMGHEIFSVVLQIVGSQTDADDVYQEVMLTILQSADQYTPGTNAKAWILKIARSRATDLLRRQRQHLPLEEVEYLLLQDDGITEAVESMSVSDAMKTLSSDDRLILSLKLHSGLKLREIAEVMSMTDSAVEKRYERAIEKLRKILK